MGDSDAVISVRDLKKTYRAGLFGTKRINALQGVSLDVPKGQVFGLLGPNGAGKTTLIKILLGIVKRSSGNASVLGLPAGSRRSRRRIGYLPENVPLYSEARIEEALEFQGRLHRLGRSETKRRAAEILERVGLSDRRRSLVGSLSRGLRQRAGLAVALLARPEVLILDEPTSGLDPLQRIEVRDLISELAAEHTVLLSSHILAEIEALCPRVVILNKGKMAADGTPEELTAQLGGGSAVRLEAFCMDPDEALGLLKQLPGVTEVRPTGKLGIHSGFDVIATEDVREDVGALAAAKGWAIRELSWRRPSLERIFASIALELDGLVDTPGSAVAEPSGPAPDAQVFQLDGSLGASSGSSLPVEQPSPTKSLNPFENFGASPPPSSPPPAGGGAATLTPFEGSSGSSKPAPEDPA